jgi:hypothetical protein
VHHAFEFHSAICYLRFTALIALSYDLDLLFALLPDLSALLLTVQLDLSLCNMDFHSVQAFQIRGSWLLQVVIDCRFRLKHLRRAFFCLLFTANFKRQQHRILVEPAPLHSAPFLPDPTAISRRPFNFHRHFTERL